MKGGGGGIKMVPGGGGGPEPLPARASVTNKQKSLRCGNCKRAARSKRPNTPSDGSKDNESSNSTVHISALDGPKAV